MLISCSRCSDDSMW